MELDVFQLHGLGLAAARALEQDLVVKAQPQLRHSRQVDPHLDGPYDLAAQHISIGVGQQVHRLDDVEEDLVLAVFNALGAPGDGIGYGHRYAGQPRWVAQLSYSGKFHNYNIGLATLRFKRHYFDKIKYFLVFFYLIKKVVNTPTLFKF